MVIEIITIFPEFFSSVLSTSILGRAIKTGDVTINLHDLRKWSEDSHQSVDDRPFGGGPGMVMMVKPIYLALKELGVYPKRDNKTKVILTAAVVGNGSKRKQEK
jgi:tRNA (guanine37-N1)-methyltransferase